MADIAPLKALYYDREKVKDIGLVATPPYDVISPEMRRRFLERHPYNIVRLILPDDYGGASRTFKEWLQKGVFRREESPSIYPYQQVFSPPEAEERLERWGFIALVRLEDGAVIGHERTMDDVVKDRLSVLESTGVQMGQIFSLFSDPKGEVERLIKEAVKGRPRFEFTDDEGVTHRLWQLSDPLLIKAVARRLQGQRLLIADGHHRYSTALRFRELMRQRYPEAPAAAPFEFVAMYLTPMESEGLLILPTHRLVPALPEEALKGVSERMERFFQRRTFSPQHQGELFRAIDRGEGLGFFRKGKGFALLLPRDGLPISGVLRRIDAALVDELLLRGLSVKVDLTRDREEAVRAVLEGRYEMAFLLRPPRVQDLKAVVEQGELMPKKSTYFYPKVASGLVLFPVAEEGEVIEPLV